ncbi:hypothetical protein F7734_06070 [Scytonema sp. UIC 10036]|uniref:hypothetical protein n=1 Tax=Scytonema sp. UIC 10036 TaxID=2304196 RepID=UPI0012DA8E1E|nr:hypothetical protein [Scytonema sp. UIC 10036]MUG92050.1 hypothetical protein [Scytonema sp. UIC 10036]
MLNPTINTLRNSTIQFLEQSPQERLQTLKQLQTFVGFHHGFNQPTKILVRAVLT